MCSRRQLAEVVEFGVKCGRMKKRRFQLETPFFFNVADRTSIQASRRQDPTERWRDQLRVMTYKPEITRRRCA